MKNFDRDFERMRKMAMIFWIFGLLLTLALIGFGVWVIIMLLRFFGVV